MSIADQAFHLHANERHIRFVDRTASGDTVLMTFVDPVPCYAILADVSSQAGPAAGIDSMDVVLLLSPVPAQSALPISADWTGRPDDANQTPPVFVKYRGVELGWRPGRAVLHCDPEQADVLLAAIVEFTHYERELRRIEEEIAGAWSELEQDKALAFEVTSADLERSQTVGGRMDRTLQRRIRHARIEPHLYRPEARLPSAAQKLGEELRERAQIEARLETLDGQLEVFEHVYEMGSQRMGEYRAARQEHVLEWVIIVLLGAEAALMLAQVLLRRGL